MKYVLDEALIAGIRANSQKSEDLIFDRFLGIEQYYSIPDDAKCSLYVDTISDVILNLRKQPYIEVDNLKAYVKKILDNKFRALYKMKKSDQERYAQFDPQIMERTMGDIPPTQLDATREEKIIELAKEVFELLSNKCKEVLRARFIEGLSFKELAGELDYASEGSARLANHDCLKQAKKKCSQFKDRYYGE